MEESKLVLNKSFLYLFPIIYRDIIIDLNINYNLFLSKDLMLTLFNTYCYVEDNKQFAIAFTYTEVSDTILDTFNKSKYFVTYYIKDDNIVLMFDIPEKSVNCYNKFINGKYSKYLEEDKQEVIKFISKFLVTSEVAASKRLLDKVISVLKKSPDRVKELREYFGLSSSEWNNDWEVSSIIDVDKENFKMI